MSILSQHAHVADRQGGCRTYGDARCRMSIKNEEEGGKNGIRSTNLGKRNGFNGNGNEKLKLEE